MTKVFHAVYVEGDPYAFKWIIHESVDGSGEHWKDIVRSPRTYRTWWEAHEEGGHALLRACRGLGAPQSVGQGMAAMTTRPVLHGGKGSTVEGHHGAGDV